MTVHYADGSSGILEFEKPPGAHPDSIAAIAEGILVAEKNGKRVERIGRSFINPFSSPERGPLVIEENLITRDEALQTLQLACRPMNKRYASLF